MLLKIGTITFIFFILMQHNYDPGSLLKRVGKEGKGEKEEEEERGRRKEKGGVSHSPYESAETQMRRVHLQSRTPDMVEIPAGGC